MEGVEEPDIPFSHFFLDSFSQNSLEGIVSDIQIEELQYYTGLADGPLVTISCSGYMRADSFTDFSGNRSFEFMLGNGICDPFFAVPLDAIPSRNDGFLADFYLEDGVANDHDICEFGQHNQCADFGSPGGLASNNSSSLLDATMTATEVTTEAINSGELDPADYDVWDIEVINQTEHGFVDSDCLGRSKSLLANRSVPNCCLEPSPSQPLGAELDTTAEHLNEEYGKVAIYPVICTTNCQGSFSGEHPGDLLSELDTAMVVKDNTEIESSCLADESLSSHLSFSPEKERDPTDSSDEKSSNESSLLLSSCDGDSVNSGIQSLIRDNNTVVLMGRKKSANSNEMGRASNPSLKASDKSFVPEDGVYPGSVKIESEKRTHMSNENKDSWTDKQEEAITRGGNFPQSVKYCAFLSQKGKTERKKMKFSMDLNHLEMIEEAKKQLMRMEWDIEFREEKRGCRYRYESPRGKRFYSLAKACKEAMRIGGIKHNEHCIGADPRFPQRAVAATNASQTNRISLRKRSNRRDLYASISNPNSKDNPSSSRRTTRQQALSQYLGDH